MASPYRFLAVDLDGTLLNSSGKLSAGNRAALHRAHQAGITVCLCTGRNPTESGPVIEALGLDLSAGVFVFGAVVKDLQTNATIFRNAMSAELADRLIAHLASRGHPILALYDPGEADCDYVLVEGRENREAYERWLAYAPARTQRLTKWEPRACTPLRIGVIERPDRIEQTLADLRAEFSPDEAKINSIYAPNYGLHVVECFASQVNKWHGIMQLAGRMGLFPAEIATIGDDVNDIEMIAQAGLGVAMGNAIPAVKQAAKAHVPDHDHDGVAVLVHRLLDEQASSFQQKASAGR